MNFAPTSSPQTDVASSLVDWLVHFYNSPFVFVLKILIGVYVFVIFVDIILLLILRDVPSSFRTGMRGMDIPIAPKKKTRKRWDAIKARLSSNNVSQYKVAVIEADAMVDEILSGIGYSGQNMNERFEQVQPAHLDSHYEALRDAHSVRNRIVHEADFAIDQKTAHDVISVYENFLKYLEYLD